MKCTYDRATDAAYISIVEEIGPGEVRRTYTCDPTEVGGQINLDFDESGRLLGIEVLDATRFLPRAFLAKADPPSEE